MKPCSTNHSLYNAWTPLFLLTMLFGIVLQSGSLAIAPQTDSDSLFKQAVSDFDQGRLYDAQRKFQQMHGSRADDAKQYLTKIAIYEQSVQAARDLLARPPDEVLIADINSVIKLIQKATAISAIGPEDTAGLLSRAQQLRAEIVRKDKDKEEDLCNKAREAARDDDYRTAAGFACRLAEENPDYGCGVEEISTLCMEYKSRIPRPPARGNPPPKPGPGESPAPDTDAESVTPGAPDPRAKLQAELNEGLALFDSGDYPTSIQRLTDYISNRGPRQPVARFYLGASKLYLYYLKGNQDSNLQQDAVRDLIAAKRAGYKPDETKVSPKILQVYKALKF